jgi:hypothetical protein
MKTIKQDEGKFAFEIYENGNEYLKDRVSDGTYYAKTV